MSKTKLPAFNETLPAIENDAKERVERAVFELFSAGMWFDTFELRGAHVKEVGGSLRTIPLLDENVDYPGDLVFDFRFRVANRGPLKVALTEILEKRKAESDRSTTELISDIDRKIADLQSQRAVLLNAAVDVAWEEKPEDIHPAFTQD